MRRDLTVRSSQRWVAFMAGVTSLAALVLPLAVAAPATAASLTVDPTSGVLWGQRVALHGNTGTSFARPVQLQRLSGTWQVVARATSSSTGAYRVTDSAARKGTYRVVVPQVTHNGKTWARRASTARTIGYRSTLNADQKLLPGRGIVSPDGVYMTIMQTDGNLVVYKNRATAVWASSTSGTGDRYAVMQGDGNLVVYTAAGIAVWSSSTALARRASLTMQNDGNLVMYSRGGVALWSSNGGRTRFTEASLIGGHTLWPGQALWSHSGRYRAVMQRDGNFVVYDGSTAKWNTQGSTSGSRFVAQSDGNLVVYGPNDAALWNSGTHATEAQLTLQDDGNLVLYSRGGLALWSLTGKSGYAENILPAGTELGRGQSLWSPSGRYQAVMQDDGNFVVYDGSKPTFATSTNGSGQRAAIQADGNFVIYAANGSAVWQAGTGGSHATALVMQDDGNLVVYDGSTARWSSKNAGGGGGAGSGTGGYPDADAVDCSAKYGIYSWCKNGSWASARGFAYRNCTDYVAWRKGMVWSQINSNGDGNARGWKQGWIDRGRSWGTTPKVGAVAWWGRSYGGGYGHVAYVIAVNSDGSAQVAQYNKGGLGTYSQATVRAEAYLY